MTEDIEISDNIRFIESENIKIVDYTLLDKEKPAEIKCPNNVYKTLCKACGRCPIDEKYKKEFSRESSVFMNEERIYGVCLPNVPAPEE